MRYSVSRTPNELLIVIPRKFNLFICLFIPLWTAAWIILAIESPSGKPEPVWGAVFFALVTILFASSWLWNIDGKEMVQITPEALIHRRTLFGISWDRTYNLNRITKPRFVASRSRGRKGRIPSGVGFSYDGKLIKFGDGLTQAEAKSLVATIIREFPGKTELWKTYDEGLPELDESMKLDLRSDSR